MTASLLALEPGGRLVQLWRPAEQGPVVVLLGRTATAWTASASAQPEALADAGYWPVAVGASAAADIEAAISFAGAHGADTTRVGLLAHGPGCQGALDWAVGNHEDVTAIALVSPTGVSVPTARGWVMRDVLGAGAQDTGRLAVWHTAADIDAAALAAQLAATDRTLIDPDDTAVTDLLAAIEVSWVGQEAHREMARWRDLALTGPSGAWHGGDLRCPTPLIDGRVLEPYADTVVGTVNLSDLTFDSFPVVHSSMHVRAADGSITGQLYASGSSGPAWPTPADTTTWYWVGRGVEEGTHVRFPAWQFRVYSGSDPTILFEHVNTWLLSRRLSDLAVDGAPVARSELGSLVHRLLWGYSIVVSGGWLWIYGSGDGVNGPPWSRLARCPAGALSGEWEFWSDDGWSPNVGDASPLEDVNGQPVQGGFCSVVRPSGRQFHMAVTVNSVENWAGAPPNTNRGIDIYRSPFPWGPWTFLRRIVSREDATTRYGGTVFTYQAQWLPHLAAPAGTMLLTYHAGVLAPTVPATDLDYSLFRPRCLAVPLD